VSAVQMINNLIGHTETLLRGQNAHDWTAMADAIEYDIASTVRRWPMVLNAIRESARLSAKTAA